MDGIGSLMQGAAPQGPQQSTPQGPQPRQGTPMAPQNNPSMSAAMDLATDELDALGLDPRTKAMLKTQEAYDLMQSAQRELAMAQQQPMPPTIEGQRTQQTMQGIGALMQQLSPGIQQQGQQMAMAQRRSPMQGQRPPMQGQRPPMPQQGMAGMPARNMQGMARGGVVGYAGPDGSQVGSVGGRGVIDSSGLTDRQRNSTPAFGMTPTASPMLIGGILKTLGFGPKYDFGGRRNEEFALESAQRNATPIPIGNASQPIPMLMEKYGAERVTAFIAEQKALKAKGKALAEAYGNSRAEAEAAGGLMQVEDLELMEEVFAEKYRDILDDSMGMARGGVIGYAGPDGSQVQSQAPQRPIAGQQSAAVPDQATLIAQFLAAYGALQADLKVAKPQEKDLFRQRVQDLINTTPPSVVNAAFGQGMARGGIVGYQDGGRVKRYQGTSEDGSLVEGDKAQNLRAMMQSSLPWDAAPTATAASVAENISEEEIIRLISQADDAEIARILAANFPKGSIEEQKQRKFAEVVANVNRQPAGANVILDTDVGIAIGGRGDTFESPVGVPTSGAGSPQSNIDATLSGIAALEVPKTNIGDLARSPLRDPIEKAALKNINLDASALSEDARGIEQGLASKAYAMSPEMKAAYARQQQERDAYYTAQLDPKRLKDQKINALLAGLAAPGGIARGGIEALQGVTGVGDTAAELGRKQSEERFGSAKEREGINREGRIKGFEAGSRKAQSVYERTSATVNQASQSLSQLATSDETRGQAAAVQEYTKQMDVLKLKLNVFLQKEKIGQDDRRNLQRIVADMRNAQSDIDNTITKLRSDMILVTDPEEGAAVTALIQAANVQRGLIQQEIDATLTSLGIDVAVAPSGGGGDLTPEQKAADAILGI